MLIGKAALDSVDSLSHLYSTSRSDFVKELLTTVSQMSLRKSYVRLTSELLLLSTNETT